MPGSVDPVVAPNVRLLASFRRFLANNLTFVATTPFDEIARRRAVVKESFVLLNGKLVVFFIVNNSITDRN